MYALLLVMHCGDDTRNTVAGVEYFMSRRNLSIFCGEYDSPQLIQIHNDDLAVAFIALLEFDDNISH